MIVLRNLMRRKLRTAFSVAGVGVGISLMVTLFTLSNDILGQLTDLLANDRGDLIAIEGSGDVWASRVNASVQGVPFEDILEDEPEVKRAYPMIFAFIRTESQISASSQIDFYGVTADHPVFGSTEVALDDKGKPMHVAPGEPLIVDDKSFVVGIELFNLYNSKVPRSQRMRVGEQVNLTRMLLDDLATSFGEDAGEFAHLTMEEKRQRAIRRLKQSRVDGGAIAALSDLTLRAVIEMPQQAMNAALYFSIPLAQTIKGYNKGDDNDVTFFLMELHENTPSDKNAAAERLGIKYPDLRVERTDELLGGMAEVDLISNFNWAVSIIAAIAGALGVANILILSVTERTREIGLLRALGWSRKRIVFGIIQEGIAITVLGAILGIGIGYIEMMAVIEFLNFNMVTARIDLELAGMAVSVAFVLGIIASIYPAWRASRLTPMDALRQE